MKKAFFTFQYSQQKISMSKFLSAFSTIGTVFLRPRALKAMCGRRSLTNHGWFTQMSCRPTNQTSIVLSDCLYKSILGIRASTKGRNLAFLPVRAFLKPVFIRVHFVLRPVRSYILAIFWYFLGPNPNHSDQQTTLTTQSTLLPPWETFRFTSSNLVQNQRETRSNSV